MIRVIGIGIVALLLFQLEQLLYRRLWHRGLHVDLHFKQDHIFEGRRALCWKSWKTASICLCPCSK